MDLLTWAREERKKDREEFREEFRKELEPQIKRELEPQIKRELEPQIKRELVENIVAQRLGRSLTADEQKTLADRVGELGAERVIALGFDHSPADFAAWLDSQEK
ncbi:MAG: hypothetical protein IPM54_43780 [Polyangiaceae bacterium]|nr:hypothetical protein [Polyangiaceae bacterium]